MHRPMLWPVLQARWEAFEVEAEAGLGHGHGLIHMALLAYCKVMAGERRVCVYEGGGGTGGLSTKLIPLANP